jgi:hypothetical protein
MAGAQLPSARRADVEAAPAFSASSAQITCTCGITGSTYVEPWDGSAEAAEAFAEAAGQDTAALVKRTPQGHHYAWLHAGR